LGTSSLAAIGEMSIESRAGLFYGLAVGCR